MQHAKQAADHQTAKEHNDDHYYKGLNNYYTILGVPYYTYSIMGPQNPNHDDHDPTGDHEDRLQETTPRLSGS